MNPSIKIWFGQERIESADPAEAIEYVFDTDKELDAFIKGLDAAIGWMEFEVCED
jgi:hypothetical protein